MVKNQILNVGSAFELFKIMNPVSNKVNLKNHLKIILIF